MSNQPLRILVLANVPPDPNSGAAGTVYHTNVALRELGHAVHEIWEEQLAPRRIQHGNLHSLLEQPRSYRREVLKAVRQQDFDVVMMSQPQAYLASKALKKAKFPGVVLNRSHGVELRADAALSEWHRRLNVRESRMPMLTEVLRRMLDRQWKLIPGYCDGIVVPSEDDRACLIKEVAASPAQVRTIHHGVLDEYRTSSNSQANDTPARYRRLLYVGQNSFIKGPMILIDILNDVLVADHHLTMTWVTSKSAHVGIRDALNPKVHGQVKLLDWMPQEQLLEIYDRHGVFIFPSFMEGAGKAALEAMSRGLCVVSSNTGGMRDYINHGQNGWLCEVGNVSEFVSSIRVIVSGAESMSAVSEAARCYAESKTWLRCAEGIAEFAVELNARKFNASAV